MKRATEIFAIVALAGCAWSFVINPAARFIGETLPAMALAR